MPSIICPATLGADTIAEKLPEAAEAGIVKVYLHALERVERYTVLLFSGAPMPAAVEMAPHVVVGQVVETGEDVNAEEILWQKAVV